MKLKLILAVVAALYSAFSYSAQYTGSGEVYKIGAITSRSDADFIFVSGFTDAGTCPKSGKYVIIRFPNTNEGNRAYSLALAAKMSGKVISVAVNDDIKNPNGYCFAHSVSIEN